MFSDSPFFAPIFPKEVKKEREGKKKNSIERDKKWIKNVDRKKMSVSMFSSTDVVFQLRRQQHSIGGGK